MAEKIPWAWIFYQFSSAWGKFQSAPLICGATASEIEIHLGLFFSPSFFTPSPPSLSLSRRAFEWECWHGNSLGCKMNPDTCHLMRKSSLTAWFLVLQSNMCLEPRTAVVPERLPSKADHRDFFFFGTCPVRRPCGLKISNIHHEMEVKVLFLCCLAKAYNTEKKIIVLLDTTLSTQNM